MSRFIRNLIVVASLVAVLSSAGLASANHPINSVADRRQHPNVGFWKHTTHVQPASRMIMPRGR